MLGSAGVTSEHTPRILPGGRRYRTDLRRPPAIERAPSLPGPATPGAVAQPAVPAGPFPQDRHPLLDRPAFDCENPAPGGDMSRYPGRVTTATAMLALAALASCSPQDGARATPGGSTHEDVVALLNEWRAF